jgi:hypothetical protein
MFYSKSVKRINDNIYKVDLIREYYVSATFNIYVLCLFDIDDNSMSNTCKEKNDEMDQPTLTIDSLEVPIGSITWLKAKNLNEVLNGFV